MAYRETEQTKLKRQSTKQAIVLAMQGHWPEAVAANKRLLESFPNDVDTYNRLGRAYLELGEYQLAREAYEKAVELDSYNTIAKKNLARLSHLGEVVVGSRQGEQKVEPQQFIEEVGKTGVVSLHRLALSAVWAKITAGDRANLKIDGSNLIVESTRGEYWGQVELKHGQRLIKLMEGGNKYSTTVVSATEEAVTVMIREVYQHPSQVGRLSFPPRGGESLRSHLVERMFRFEPEEEMSAEPVYTIIGGQETEPLIEESSNPEEEVEKEE